MVSPWESVETAKTCKVCGCGAEFYVSTQEPETLCFACLLWLAYEFLTEATQCSGPKPHCKI